MYNADETAGAPTAIICEKIWLAIAERRLRPGTRLKEEQLAEIFSVSRARIRQALTALERDGLVTIMPNRGAFVSEPSVDEARDVFVTRRAIEQRVVERLCERATVEDIERMRSHIDAASATSVGTASALTPAPDSLATCSSGSGRRPASTTKV